MVIYDIFHAKLLLRKVHHNKIRLTSAGSVDPKPLCSGIFLVPSPFETTCCQKLANDLATLRLLYLNIKVEPEYIQRTWDTLSKLQVWLGRVQIFEPFD